MRTDAVLGGVGLLLAMAGCITPAAVQPVQVETLQAAPIEEVVDEALAPEEPTDAPTSYRVDAAADQMLHVRAGDAHGGWSGGAELVLQQARPTNGTLTITWTSTQPLDQAIEIWFGESGGRDIAHTYGMSPIVIPIAGEDFGLGQRFWGWVEPGGPAGAIAENSVVFSLYVEYSSADE